MGRASRWAQATVLRRGHRSGAIGDQPAVLMTVQTHPAAGRTAVPSPVRSMPSRATALRLDRVSLNVADLAAATAFYVGAFGFQATPAIDAGPRLADLLGARALRVVLLRRGRQRLELAMFDPPGPLYPANSRSDDLWFQHRALVTDDIAAAYEQLSAFPSTPISRYGPQRLPGGIVAFKFRDPDGHPLELIQFPRPDPRTEGDGTPRATRESSIQR